MFVPAIFKLKPSNVLPRQSFNDPATLYTYLTCHQVTLNVEPASGIQYHSHLT